MQSWRLLQLEPSSLRQPDLFTAPTKLAANGSHLAATLYRLARASKGSGSGNGSGEAQVFSRIANRLGELIDDVRAVSVDREERRELLTLNVTGSDGTVHPARALSDGTLRFLALTLLELDPEATGLLCLEEPENGIHPDRIPAMLRLLKDIATDTEEPLGDDNPLRQVIINTHSPAVVGEVADDDILRRRQ
jgi:predicted ATPase